MKDLSKEVINCVNLKCGPSLTDGDLELLETLEKAAKNNWALLCRRAVGLSNIKDISEFGACGIKCFVSVTQ